MIPYFMIPFMILYFSITVLKTGMLLDQLLVNIYDVNRMQHETLENSALRYAFDKIVTGAVCIFPSSYCFFTDAPILEPYAHSVNHSDRPLSSNTK